MNRTVYLVSLFVVSAILVLWIFVASHFVIKYW